MTWWLAAPFLAREAIFTRKGWTGSNLEMMAVGTLAAVATY